LYKTLLKKDTHETDVNSLVKRWRTTWGLFE